MSYVVCPEYGMRTLRDAAHGGYVVPERPLLRRPVRDAGTDVPTAPVREPDTGKTTGPFGVRGVPVLALQVRGE